jgi:hypothetical protein
MATLVTHKYMPGQVPFSELERAFVARQHTLDYLVGGLKSQTGVLTLTNYVITGPRGSGKTTTTLMLCHRIVNDEDLCKTWLPVRLPEEQFRVGSLRDFFEQTLEVMAQGGIEEADHFHNCVANEDDDERSLEFAITGLHRICQSQSKRIVLIVENLDALFQRALNGKDRATLRRLLMVEPFLMIVGTAVRVFDEILEYDEVFFNFFCEVPLEPLNDEEVFELVNRRARIDEDLRILKKLSCPTYKSKIRAICRMTGGNPRLVLMLYELLGQQDVQPVVQTLRQLVDELTPLFKDVLEGLPPQQARLMDALMRSGGTAKPTELAKLIRAPRNVVTTQLSRLKQAHLVEVQGGGKGRTAYYTVPDRLFYTWYEMRYLQPHRRRIELFVDVLRVWFEAEERLESLKSLALEAKRLTETAGRHVATNAEYFAASLEGTDHELIAFGLALHAWLCVGDVNEITLILGDTTARDGGEPYPIDANLASAGSAEIAVTTRQVEYESGTPQISEESWHTWAVGVDAVFADQNWVRDLSQGDRVDVDPADSAPEHESPDLSPRGEPLISEDRAISGLPTVYDASLTLMALVERGNADDLPKMRQIADWLVSSSVHNYEFLSDDRAGFDRGFSDSSHILDAEPGSAAHDGSPAGRSPVKAALPAEVSVKRQRWQLSKLRFPPDGVAGGNKASAMMALLKAYTAIRDSDPEGAALYFDTAQGIGETLVSELYSQLTSHVIDAEHGYLSREAANARVHSVLCLLDGQPQSAAPSDTIGDQGFFYHFLGRNNLHKQNFDFAVLADVDEALKTVELTTIDTALAIAGVLTAGQYFDGDSLTEPPIRQHADQIDFAVDWQFMLDAGSNWFYPSWIPKEAQDDDSGRLGRFKLDDKGGTGQVVPATPVRLFMEPAADVQVDVKLVGGDSDLSVASPLLTFTASNWDAFQWVRLNAAEDADQANNTATVRLESSGLSTVDVAVRERDNDKPLAIEFERIDGSEINALTVPEGRTATILVHLTTAPQGQQFVDAQHSGGDADIEIIKGDTLNFTHDNWERFQPVTVRANDDPDTNDDTATLSFVSPNLPTRPISAIERDDDVAGRLVTSQVLVDDFVAQPLIAEQQLDQEFSFYNRLGGDRGEVFNPGKGQVDWGAGFVEARVLENNAHEFAGVFESLNLILSEKQPINLHAMLPSQIVPAYQLRAKAILIDIEDGQGPFRVELKTPQDALRFAHDTVLTGGAQSLRIELPSSGLSDIQLLTWIVKGPAGNFARVSRIAIEVEGQDLGPLGAFVAAYAPLLNSFNASTGLTRDRANFPAGDFDNASASGVQALALTAASQLGVIGAADAETIVQKTTDALLALPRLHGIMPHFVTRTTNPQISPKTEYSSLDTIIAWLALLEARQSLGLDTSAVEQAFRDIDWSGPNGLILPNGTISHGYNIMGERLPSGWDTFGGETFLALLGYAMSQSGAVLPNVPFPTPPTANGSGFIDELASLFVPVPAVDVWGNDWMTFRDNASALQVNDSVYHATPGPIYGASAAEQTETWNVPHDAVYQAYGLGGRFSLRNDGTQFFKEPVTAPHYAAMAAELQPDAASIMFDFLMQRGVLTPLNAVESIYLGQNGTVEPHWNSLKGGWNLGLTVLGLAKQLLGPENYAPYQAAQNNAFVQQGLNRLDQANAGSFPFTMDGDRFLRNLEPVFLNILSYSPLEPGQDVTGRIHNSRISDDLRRLREYAVGSKDPILLRVYPQPTEEFPNRMPQIFYDGVRDLDAWIIRDIFFESNYLASDAIDKGKAAIDAVISEVESANAFDRIFAWEIGNEFQASGSSIPVLENFLTEMRNHIKLLMAEPGREEFSNWVTWASWPPSDPFRTDGNPINVPSLDYFSFNAYSYDPERIRDHQAGSVTGTPYAGYLAALKERFPNVPLVVSESGLPDSPTAVGLDQARIPPLYPACRRGALSEEQVAEGLADRYWDARFSGVAGFGVFEWMDEWWKAGDPSNQVDHPEEHFGLVANSTFDWGGEEEKWLGSASGTWYFITPDGRFYRWTGAQPGADFLSGSELEAEFDGSYYADPSKLYDAPPPESGGASLAQSSGWSSFQRWGLSAAEGPLDSYFAEDSPADWPRAPVEVDVINEERKVANDVIHDLYYEVIGSSEVVFPSNSGTSLFAALRKALIGDCRGAIEICSRMIDESDIVVEALGEALVLRASMKRRLGDVNDGIHDCDKVLELTNVSGNVVAKALLIRAGGKRNQGFLDEAISDYSRVLKLSEVATEFVSIALFKRGLTKSMRGDIPSAIFDYSEVETLTDVPVEVTAMAIFNRGFAKSRLNDISGANEDYAAVCRLPGVPKNLVGDALVARAMGNWVHGDIESAINDYSLVIATPDLSAEVKAIASFNRAVLRRQMGNGLQSFADWLDVAKQSGIRSDIRMRSATEALRVASSINDQDGTTATMEAFETTLEDVSEDQRADCSLSFLRAVAEPGMEAVWVEAWQFLQQYGNGVSRRLQFLKPVAQILSGSSPSLLDSIPPEEREFVEDILQGFRHSDESIDVDCYEPKAVV